MYKYLNVQQRVPVYHLITVTTFKMCNYLSTIYFYKFKFYVPSTSSGALVSRSPNRRVPWSSPPRPKARHDPHVSQVTACRRCSKGPLPSWPECVLLEEKNKWG